MPEERKKNQPLVVGIGASAGGLDPLKEFFKSLPERTGTGMAFIVVLHLSPHKESNLSEILQRETSMKVQQVQESTDIESDHVYVIPPNKLLSVENNHLELSEPEKEDGIDSIDLLFRTLGQKKQKYAAGIIFSGTGSDGVTGMRIIKEESGFTIAQQPEEAGYADMPSNAINSGVVDKVLSVKEMAEELVQYRDTLEKVRISEEAEELSEKKDTEKILAKIFEHIRSGTGHDFSHYRRSSVLRRIDRRMRVTRVQSLSEYVLYIEENPAEVDALYQDLLINVTHFFRNPEAFEAVKKQVIPQLFEGKGREGQVRVWVPACATGEEAYSLAILLLEYAKEKGFRQDIQLFASDLDNEALEMARTGRYPKSISNDISEQRLQRFFNESHREYIVKDEVREMILFAKHDLLRNPPFSKLDFISCRNLLIYLNRELQTEVFNLFHYALRDNGYLLLGKSDATLGSENLFKPVDKTFRIYQQILSKHSRTPLPDLPLLHKSESAANYYKNTTSGRKNKLEKIHWGILARIYAPQSVLLTNSYQVIHSTEGISKFLEYGGGEPSQNILDMVKPEMRKGLRSLLLQLKKEHEGQPVHNKFQVKADGKTLNVEVIARRFSEKDFPEGMIQVVFKELAKKSDKKSSNEEKSGRKPDDKNDDIIESLKSELEHTKEQLQISVEEYETSNEELRASNDELQSMNEELKTVNNQLEDKVAELSRAHSDLENLMEATEVGIIFVDRSYRVQRFTSSATEIFNLIESDKGRPLQHITHLLRYDEMLDDINDVLKNLKKIKKVLSTEDGRWFIMRLRPYHSLQNKIEGVVLSFTEFTELKEARETIEEQTFQETLATLGVYALEQEDLNQIMHRAIQQSCVILNLECAAILMLSDDEKTLSVASEAGCGCESMELENNDKWDLGYCLTYKDPVSVLHYEDEKRFERSPLLKGKEINSSVHIALRGTENVFGVLGVYSEEKREFSKMELQFLQVAASIIGRSVERKMFKDELLEANKQLQREMERTKQVKKELINNNVLQRWELGGYLHDTFGQLLASTKILIDDIKLKMKDSDVDITEEADQISKIMDECIKGIRNITHEIIPVDVEEEGVSKAFRMVMHQTFSMYGVKCVLEKDETLNEIKNREAATHLYYIVQETFKNAATHGKADLIIMSVKKEGDQFILQVKDNGVGFEKTDDGMGKGIRIMKYRADLMDGTLDVETYSDEKHSGTVVTCRLPMKNLKRKNK